MNRLIYTALLYLQLATIVGQQPAFFKFKYLQQGDGVEDLMTYCVLKDRLGILWVGGNMGIKYYDGFRLQQFELNVDNVSTASKIRVSSFAEDQDGRLWIGTDTGLVILSTDRSKFLLPSALGIPPYIAKANNSHVQADENGHVLFLSGSTFYKVDSEHNNVLVVANISDFPNAPKSILNFVYVPRERAYYIYTDDSQLFMLRDRQLKNVNYSLYQRGSRQPSLRLNLTLLTFWLLQDSLCLVSHNVITKNTYPIHLDHNQARANYSSTNSLQTYLPVVQAWHSYCSAQGSPIDPNLRSDIHIRDLQYDNNGCWYLATSIGVFIAREYASSFQSITWTKGRSTRAITQASDSLWLVASYDKLLYGNLSDSTCHMFTSAPAWNFFQKSSQSWDFFAETPFSAYNVTFRNHSKPFLKQLYSDKVLPFYYTAVATEQGYWLASVPFTLQYFHRATGTVVPFYASSVQRNTHAVGVNKTLLIQGRTLWAAGTSGLQAYRLNDSGNQILEELTYFLPDTLRNTAINCLYPGHDGNLWIGSASFGIWSYQPERHTLRHWATTQGLAYNNVYSIIGSHSDSVMWIGTQHGLSRMEVWNNSFCNYYTVDGLLNDEFNTASVYRSSNGTIFMGGPNGISYFKPREVPIKPSLTSGLTIVEIQNSSRHTRRRLFPSPGSTLTLQPEDDHVTLAFRSTDFFKDRNITFRYRLVGLQEEWRYTNLEQQEVFTSLRPGEYTLEVQLQSNTGIWGNIYTLNVVVLPAWHQTWWFKALLVLALALGFHSLYLYRLRQLRKEYDLRKQVSDDLHDDLGSRIFALKALASKVARPEQSDDVRQQASEEFEALSKEVLGRVREFIWVFNPEHDQLIHFLDRLDDYIQVTIRPLVKSITYLFNVDERIKFVSSSRHHLMMIVQELLVNMSKHTLEPVIQVKAYVTDTSLLRIDIINRHAGITATSGIDRHSYGLASIEKRLTQYGIQMEWNENESSQMAALSVKIATPYV